jgi:tyrosinase
MPGTLEEPSMDIRKSAVDLSAGERDRFLEALIRLKHRPVPNGPAGASVYDQFVALHGAVFAVLAPGLPPGDTVNFGHWNIGFCAWHRKYLREFERALQVGAPTPLAAGVLRNPVPPADRPAWWPAGAEGFPIHPLLEGGFGTVLARGSVGVGWPPTAAGIQQLEQLVIQQPGVHPFWYFWLVLEQGHQQVTSRTHNRGHNFIGGHMSTGFSPNDPVFWLHHANVDRLWANWQAGRLAEVPGSTPQDHYPPPGEVSPLDGDPAPLGHRLDDQMWPWVGGAAGFDVEIDPAVKPLLPDFSGAPAVTVREVLQTETIDPEGYRYAAPGQP